MMLLEATSMTRRERRKVVFAATVGNFVEWYDFGIYAVLAPTLATLFFPSAERWASLLATFAVFGVAFLVRPIGAVVIGSYGDRLGRRGVLALVILLISGATFGIGLLPTYGTVGVLAPTALVVLRLVQGFSAGGEFGGATSYLIEYAPPGRRGLYASWQPFSQGLALLVGLLLAAALSLLPPDAYLSWGWRVPFLVALPLGLVGLYVRLRLDETPSFQQLQRARQVESAPFRQTVRQHPGALFRVIGVIALLTALAYLVVFLPTYFAEAVGRSRVEALGGTILCVVVGLVAMPFVAAFSDRVGRRPLILGACVGSLVGIVPVFYMMQGSPLLRVSGLLLLGFLVGVGGCAVAAFAELFPTGVRYSGLSIGYAFGVSIFGGVSPLVFSYLISVTGSSVSPAYYVLGTALVATLAALTFPETAPAPNSPAAR